MSETIISLTSVPPRFDGLGPVLESLLAQRADRVVLVLPHRWHRFPGRFAPPSVPFGVEILRCDDLGPAVKVLPVGATFPEAEIIYCDDDCLYGAGWLTKLQAGQGLRAASCFEVARLGRAGGLVAQGFAGVRVPSGVALPETVPVPVRAADDLWLSAWFSASGLTPVDVPEARALVTPQDAPAGLQDLDRAGTYAGAVEFIYKELGVWPPLQR